ncbi:MAG: divalent-cation tolerance protein CutA [Flavobacteriales bacterium]
MTDYVMVYVVCSSEMEASSIGKELVESRLAACVNIFPAVQSIYWWEGKVKNGKEVALFAKTHYSKFEPIRQKVMEMHSYECPCVITLAIKEGDEDYLDWIGKEVK